MATKMAPTPAPPPGLWLTADESAELLGIARSHFDKKYNSRIEGGDRAKRGRVMLYRGRSVLLAFLRGTEAEGEVANENDWAVRRSRALALEAEDRLAVTRRALIPREESIQRETQMALVFKNAMLALPIRIAPLLVNLGLQEIEAKLREHVHGELTAMVNEKGIN